MADSLIRLSVPAEATYARSVRMMAANLAVVCSMSVDEVEDARMAAEEAFVYACATGLVDCHMTFGVSEDALTMTFSLGKSMPAEGDAAYEQVSLAELLLSAVCDSYEISADHTRLSVCKRSGGVYAH